MQNSTRTWVIVANRAQAGIYAYDAEARKINPVRTMVHESGRKRRREIDTSRPGGSVGPTGRSFHAMVREKHDAVRESAERFSRRLARWLNGERGRGSFDRAVLAAEPRFLGMLREQLNAGTLAVVSRFVRKDLAHAPVHALPAHLGLDVRPRNGSARAASDGNRRRYEALT